MTESAYLPGTAWDIEARAVARDHDRSIGNARDLVILDWLAKGDTRPFADWALRGHTPSPNVLKALAVMMTRADNPRFNPAGIDDPELSEIVDLFPLGLAVTGKGKRRADLANVERDKRIALEVAKAMSRGSSMEKARDDVTDWLASIGFHLGTDAVEKAYKTYKGSIFGTNSAASVP